MMKEHYLDNSATTPLCNESRQAMETVMEQCYGNPSSLHTIGLQAEKIVNESRGKILAALGEKQDRLTATPSFLFTSGGTEANNLALSGTAHAKAQNKGKKLIISDSEHASVEATAKALEQEGYVVVRIGTRGGVYNLEMLEREMTKDTFLVSTMLVNNETGAIYPLAEISRIAKRVNPDCVIHCDAVQGFCHVPFTPKTLGADLVSISSHKIGGPKGIGGLYVAPSVYKTKRLVPILHGGEQQGSMRPGTENTVGIAGFGAAASVAKDKFAHLDLLREYLKKRLVSEEAFGNTVINEAPAENRACHILSLTVPQIRSETMMHHLSKYGVYVSNGSACSSHSTAPNRPLTAFGLDKAARESTLRISFGEQNTQEDVDAFLQALQEGMNQLCTVKKK